MTDNTQSDVVVGGVFPNDQALLMGLSIMATRLEADGLINAALYMRTGAERLAALTSSDAVLEAEIVERCARIAERIGECANTSGRASQGEIALIEDIAAAIRKGGEDASE